MQSNDGGTTSAPAITITEETSKNPQRESLPIPGHLKGRLTALNRQARKIVKAQHHLEVLEEYLKKKTPPRGLTPRIKAQVPYPPTAFTIKWEDTLYNCAIELIKQLIEFWQSTHTKASQEYTQINDELRNATEDPEWEMICHIVEEVKRETQQELKCKKQKPRRSTTKLPLAQRRNTAGSNAQLA